MPNEPGSKTESDGIAQFGLAIIRVTKCMFDLLNLIV